MKPPNGISKALETFALLEKEIVAAQKVPMDARIRAELVRVAAATKKSLGCLAASHQAAVDGLSSKKKQAAERVAANKAVIAKNQAAIAAKAQPQPPRKPPTPPTIDPTLGARLAQELLARQAGAEVSLGDTGVGAGVLDDWDWTARVPEAVSNGNAAPCG